MLLDSLQLLGRTLPLLVILQSLTCFHVLLGDDVRVAGQRLLPAVSLADGEGLGRHTETHRGVIHHAEELVMILLGHLS